MVLLASYGMSIIDLARQRQCQRAEAATRGGEISPEGGSMQLTERHRQYWKRNLRLTMILLAIWFVVTFVVGWYARELQGITFLGFPLPFYMGAQGSLIVYVL